jgi:glucosamine--fructose-6-phosphate aminotransferase (isomerizing)
MSKSMEIMAEEIAAQAKIFELCGADIMKQVSAIFDKTDLVSKIDRVYITGCGDSYCAALACRDLFIKYTQVHVEVHQAIEFSRYICPNEVDERAAVLSISSSGRVARTVECALRAKEKNAASIGITSNPKSPLAESAGNSIVVKIPDVIGIAPGTQSYMASLLAIICFAIALGKERGVLDEDGANSVFDYITELGEAMKQTVKSNFDLISKYISVYTEPENPNKIRIFHILGSGPNWGTAQFGTMKLLEASGFDSVPQGIEEWAHAQYFTTKPGTHVVVIAPKGESRDRALEILQAVTVMDGKKVVIGEENDEELARAADIYLPICGMTDIKEEFSQLIYAIPLELMALHMGEALGVQAFEFEKKPWRKSENFRQIFKSKIRPLNKSNGEVK